MFVKSLQIGCFRNFQFCQFLPSKSVNFLFGENGSGKTSLFEAIYVLGMGRSFRAPELISLVKYGCDGFSLKMETCIHEQKTQIIEYKRMRVGELLRRSLDHKKVGLVDVAKIIPIQFINYKDYQILSDSPFKRRQLLDWGLFHVEQSFHLLWKKYKCLLKQRNAALKGRYSITTITAFDKHLIEVVSEINLMRRNIVKQIEPYVHDLSRVFFPQNSLSLLFKQGWSEGIEYEEMLKKRLKYDIILGHTQQGPHRADFEVFCEGMSVQYQFSLGQQKILSVLLKIAVSRFVYALTKKKVIYLIDDLLAELDRENKEKVLALIKTLDGQVFLSSIENKFGDYNDEESCLFHVEHGRIQRAAKNAG